MGNHTTNVIFAGVGGQGVLLASELLALTAMAAGFDAKQTEVHGVSQRGGSVYGHVRYGPKVHSPLIRPGQAHAVVGMEKLESLRFAHYVRPDGILIVNEFEIVPASVGALAEKYPHHAVEFLRQKGQPVLAVPAGEMARALGDIRVSNILLLGVLSCYLHLPLELWEQALVERIPERYLDINRRAFHDGRKTKETQG